MQGGAQTGQEYSDVEKQRAVAVVLRVWWDTPQFVPCSFLRKLFCKDTFVLVF